MEKDSRLERPGVFIKTFGCQFNEYDTEKMLAGLAAEYARVDSADDAGLVIVNTCSVRDKAEHKLYSLLGELRDLKEKRPEMIIGVSGCVAQQEGEALARRCDAVDFVVGTHNISLVPSLVRAAREGKGRQIAVDYRDEWEDLPDSLGVISDTVESDAYRSAFNSPVRGLVSIQRGCDKHCSFCVVPTTRGPEVSRDAKEILREVTFKVRAGAREILLLGQTVNSYGRDLTPRVPFDELVRRIADIEGVLRIRFISPHPADVRTSFIRLYETVPQLCPHIHLPLQSGSNRILKLMNRNYRVERYQEIVSELRSVRPDIALSTDIIVGFPTESDVDFEQTMAIVRELKYTLVFSFVYSPRPNTVAQAAFSPDQVIGAEVSQERIMRLQTMQNAISATINEQFLQTAVPVLVEGRSQHISSGMRGRTPHNTVVDFIGDDLRRGTIVPVLVERTSAYSMRGTCIMPHTTQTELRAS